MITGWGWAPGYKDNHKFREGDGLPSCTDDTKHRRYHRRATVKFSQYNPGQPGGKPTPYTCPHCKEIEDRERQQEALLGGTS